MFVVIFRATVRQLDEHYSQMAARMRELALTEFGCLGFHAVTEGHSEVALSYWPDEAAIRAWKNHPEHLLAQQHGVTAGTRPIRWRWLRSAGPTPSLRLDALRHRATSGAVTDRVVRSASAETRCGQSAASARRRRR